MAKLEDHVGKTIWLKPRTPLPEDDLQQAIQVTLHGVEAGGIWVQGQPLTEAFKEDADWIANSPGTDPLFFFPYSEILFLSVGEGQQARAASGE